MNETTLLIAFIAVTAVAVVLQTLILAGIFVSARKAGKQVEALATRVNEQVLPLVLKVLPLVEKVLSRVDENAPKVQTVIANLAETSDLVRSQAGKIDEAITEIVGIARTQAGNVDVLATRTMRRADATAEAVQHVVMTPLRQVTALMEGVAAGMGNFVGGRKVRRDKPVATDDMFI
jgi:methyl-accepting chemotaxis protein